MCYPRYIAIVQKLYFFKSDVFSVVFILSVLVIINWNAFPSHAARASFCFLAIGKRLTL